MLQISLRDFLETGSFGPVALGQKRDIVKSLLGEPDDFSNDRTKHGKPRIWKYGDIEFHFDDLDDCLNMIHSDDFLVPIGSKKFDLDPWILKDELSLANAMEILSVEGIGFEETDAPCGYLRWLKTSANVYLAFANHDKGKFYLASFWISKERE